jgi:hypothetical protein
MAISAITFVYFSGFNAPLLRTMADTESVQEEPIITNGAPVIDVSSSSKEELQNVNK